MKKIPIFIKDKVKDILKDFNENLSESENMSLNRLE